MKRPWRTSALWLARAVAVAAAATAGNAAAIDGSTLEAEVSRVVQDMAARWEQGRRHTIVTDLWDTADARAIYLAGEQPDWLVGTAAMQAYLAPRPNSPPSVSSYVIEQLRVRALSNELAIATWNLDYQFKRGDLAAMRERLRVTAMLRRTNSGWKFFYYAESPKSSLTYLRELYESIVTPEFKAKAAAAAR